MACLVRVRKARKPHVCDTCRKPIPPGQTYEVWAAPPHDSDIGNGARWWTLKVHIPGT